MYFILGTSILIFGIYLGANEEIVPQSSNFTSSPQLADTQPFDDPPLSDAGWACVTRLQLVRNELIANYPAVLQAGFTPEGVRFVNEVYGITREDFAMMTWAWNDYQEAFEIHCGQTIDGWD